MAKQQRGGVFTLGNVGELQETGSWNTASDVWLIGSPVLVKESSFGYYAGGSAGLSPLSNVDRIDYSNDTSRAAARGPLTGQRYHSAGNSSSAHAYFAGGAAPGAVSTIDRIDYSNDTSAVTVRGTMTAARYLFAGAGNVNFGYFAGGNPGSLSSVDRMEYANDTATALAKGPLATAGTHLTGTGNQSNAYFGSFATKSTINRLDYSNDSKYAVD